MKRLLLLLTLIFALGCTRSPAETITANPSAVIPTFSARELPVTFTPVPTIIPVTPTPIATPTPPGPTATPIDFGQTTVELRYRIPALNLERRLQGNVASQIIFVDETTGTSLKRNNMMGVLLELQQALPELALDSQPEGCTTCVYIEYELPLADEAGAGWLQDPVLLASIENIMATVLGPHFPPNTLVGLRRSASPYAPAHSLAITTDGSVWTWLATEPQIDDPLTTAAIVPNIDALLSELPSNTLGDDYTTSCPGVPLETLSLNLPDLDKEIKIICPEFTLPTTLLPLYLSLDQVLQPKLAALDGPQRPPAGFPLAAVLDYRRQDGARLTLYQDGTSVAQTAANEVYTNTLTIPEVISLTTNLVDSGLVNLGLTTFFTTEVSIDATSRLLVRGTDGVYDAQWTGTETAVSALDALLNASIPNEETETPVPTETVTTPTSEETPSAAETAVPTPTP